MASLLRLLCLRGMKVKFLCKYQGLKGRAQSEGKKKTEDVFGQVLKTRCFDMLGRHGVSK